MKRLKIVLPLLAALAVGFLLRGCFVSSRSAQPQTSDSQPQATIWTCSMHPQIRLPKPGKCPICAMDLIPLQAGEAEQADRPELQLSPYSAKLMQIETAPVVRRFVAAEVRMVGNVDYDETRVAAIEAWVPGRIDRLFVDYTGIPVRKGDHLAELYSPDLLTAQEELIQAIQTLGKLTNSESTLLVATARKTVDAAREKLRLWGFTKEQVEAIETRGAPSDHMTIYSPASGIVIHKDAQEGMYVQTGSRIYTIADLSKVWVRLDAYESDLGWLRYGEPVEFTTEAYAGDLFKGTISFIDPMVDMATRTTKVRVVVDNADGRLKPGMFVHAVVRPKIAADGRILIPDLAGKWICPMHPEVVKDGPGACDVCGMALVTAESLGYVAESSTQAPLVIPATAALLTGKRAVVYVQVPNSEKPTYEGRVVDLGPKLGGFYEVKGGLEEGEQVVVRGNFKIDAELQIRAKPSMMSLPNEQPATPDATAQPPPPEVPAAFRARLDAALKAYFAIQNVLAHDDSAAAHAATADMQAKLADVDAKPLKDDARAAWTKQLDGLDAALASLSSSDAIDKQREAFRPLSRHMEETLRAFPAAKPTYLIHCPMAFNNQGATWLQADTTVLNPYLGQAMPRCGEVQETLGARHE